MKPVRLLWLVLIFALGWTAWWGWAAWQARSGLEGWLEERRAAGWQAEWDAISLRGFPSRLDRTITGLTLADTAGGWVWSAPFFQILGLIYQPDHLILVWPDEMVVQTTQQRIALTGEDLKGSITFLPGPAREVKTATLVFKGLAFAADAGWKSSITELRLAMRPAGEPGENRQEIGLEAIGLKPGGTLSALLERTGVAPAEVDRLKADLVVTFDRPWDRQAIEQSRPQPRSIDIRDVSAKWGVLELRMAGHVTVDDAGVLSGEVMIKSANWREMLDLAQDAGVMPEALRDTLEQALSLLSSLAGRANTLDIPLTFKGGRTTFGPVPLGPAPVIHIP